MRGLKHRQVRRISRTWQSHPLRMRGLKLRDTINFDKKLCRILYGCVDWNSYICRTQSRFQSHPLRMRGLKPFFKVFACLFLASHPLRMRGLKRLSMRSINRSWISRILYGCVDWNNKKCFCWFYTKVASFTDAWIETLVSHLVSPDVESHPLRMRGLKRKDADGYKSLYVSHPLRMRGLKHTGTVAGVDRCRRILYGCVDWNCLHLIV